MPIGNLPIAKHYQQSQMVRRELEGHGEVLGHASWFVVGLGEMEL